MLECLISEGIYFRTPDNANLESVNENFCTSMYFFNDPYIVIIIAFVEYIPIELQPPNPQ